MVPVVIAVLRGRSADQDAGSRSEWGFLLTDVDSPDSARDSEAESSGVSDHSRGRQLRRGRNHARFVDGRLDTQSRSSCGRSTIEYGRDVSASPSSGYGGAGSSAPASESSVGDGERSESRSWDPSRAFGTGRGGRRRRTES